MKLKSYVVAALILALGLISIVHAAPPDPFTNQGGNNSGPGGYSGVVSSGQTNNVAYYAATGTTVFGNKLMLINNGALTLGQSGTAAGSIGLSGLTSGVVVIIAPSAVSSYTLTLPSTPGINGYVLTTDGTGVTTWQPGSGGGGGVNPGTIHQLAYYSFTGDVVSGNPEATIIGGQLTLGDIPTPTAGSIVLIGSTSGSVTISAPAVAGSTTFQLPPNNGTTGQVLTTDGTGVTTWTTVSGGSGIPYPTNPAPAFGFLQTNGSNVATWQAPWANGSSNVVLSGSLPPLIVNAANVTMTADTALNVGTDILATGTVDITHALYASAYGYQGGVCDANGVQYAPAGPIGGYLPSLSTGTYAGGNGGGSYGNGGAGGFNTYTQQGSGSFGAGGTGSFSLLSGSGGSAGMCAPTYTSVGGTGTGIIRVIAVGAITIDGTHNGSVRNDGSQGQSSVQFTNITIGGSITASDVVTLIFTNVDVFGSPLSIPYTVSGGDTTSSIASALNTAINGSTPLSSVGITSTVVGSVITVKSAVFYFPTSYSYTVSGSATETVTIGATADHQAGAGGGGGGTTVLASQTSITYINSGYSTAEGGEGGYSVDYGGGGGGGGGEQVLIAPTVSGACLNEDGGTGGPGGCGGCGNGQNGGNGASETILQVPTLPLLSMVQQDLPAMVAIGDAQHIVHNIPGRNHRWVGRAATEYLAALNAKDASDFQRLCYELDTAIDPFTASASAKQEAMIGMGDAVTAPSSGCSAPGPYDRLYLGAPSP